MRKQNPLGVKSIMSANLCTCDTGTLNVYTIRKPHNIAIIQASISFDASSQPQIPAQVHPELPVAPEGALGNQALGEAPGTQEEAPGTQAAEVLRN